MRHLLIRPLDEEAQVVVVNLDVGGTGFTCYRICLVSFHTPSYLEIRKKKLLSHYDFREQFVRAWLESDSGNESQRK
jgi:hexokinase